MTRVLSGLVVRVWIRNCQVTGSNLTAGHNLQATLSKLLTYSAQVNSASYPQQDGEWVTG